MVNTYRDYIPYLQEEFPDLPKEVIEKIITTGISGMQDLVHRDHDLRIWNAHDGREYHLGLVRSITSDKERQSRAYKNQRRLLKLREKRKKQ